LSFSQLYTILADNNLNIGNEVIAWKALVAWIEHSPTERIVNFWPLFLLVRNQLMHSQMFGQMALDFARLDSDNGFVLSDKKTFAGE